MHSHLHPDKPHRSLQIRRYMAEPGMEVVQCTRRLSVRTTISQFKRRFDTLGFRPIPYDHLHPSIWRHAPTVITFPIPNLSVKRFIVVPAASNVAQMWIATINQADEIRR